MQLPLILLKSHVTPFIRAYQNYLEVDYIYWPFVPLIDEQLFWVKEEYYQRNKNRLWPYTKCWLKNVEYFYVTRLSPYIGFLKVLHGAKGLQNCCYATILINFLQSFWFLYCSRPKTKNHILAAFLKSYLKPLKKSHYFASLPILTCLCHDRVFVKKR